jgi:hypothetical protein
MNYIKVNLGGQERGLKFNNYGIEKLSEKMAGNSAIAFTYAMFWGGLIGNSFAKEQDVDYTFSDVIDWVDAIPKDDKAAVIESVTKVLTESQNYKDLIAAGTQPPANESEEEKKSELEKPIMVT